MSREGEVLLSPFFTIFMSVTATNDPVPQAVQTWPEPDEAIRSESTRVPIDKSWCNVLLDAM